MYKNKNRRKITPENEISARNLQKFIKNFKTVHAPSVQPDNDGLTTNYFFQKNI